FWQYLSLYLGFGPKGSRIGIGDFLRDLVVTQWWLARPVGVLAAAVTLYLAERAAGGAEWDPHVQRRQLVDRRAQARKVARLLADPREDRLPIPPLGIALDGDLPAWGRGRYVVPPAFLRGKAIAVVGAPGAGKTVTLCRLVYIAARQGLKVAFANCKGTDSTLVLALVNAYLLGNPAARIGRWPQTPMDMWRGTPSQVQSRLLAGGEFREPFYQRGASAGRPPAVGPPGPR